MSATSPAGPPAVGPAPLRRFLARAALWLLLGGWVGAWVLFGAVIAPTAFRVLPSTQVAGELVGPVIAVLHLYGAAAGIALALLAWALGRGRLLRVLPLLLAALCLYSHFGVSARISEIRDRAFGAEGSSEAAARFGALHERSLHLFIAVGAGALLLVGMHAWADSRPESDAASAGTTRKATKIS
jgi:hypothetical protein